MRHRHLALAVAALAAIACGAAAGAQEPSTRAPLPPLGQDIEDLHDCTEPVLLVVWIDDLDRAKSGPYGQALRSSQIVRRHGGEYKAVSPPLLVLEGEWPSDRGFVAERYPCRAAFERFWFSKEYQEKIRPLREGSGRYSVALFAEPPATSRSSTIRPDASPSDETLARRLASRPTSAPWPKSWFEPLETVQGSVRPTPVPKAKRRSVSQSALDQAAAYARGQGGQALLVWRAGQLELADFASGFDALQTFNSYHMHWLPLVLLTGVAVDAGTIASLDDRIERYLPEWRGDLRGAIRVRDLLSMSAGLELYLDSTDPKALATQLFFGGDRERTSLSWPADVQTNVAWSPGSKFEYNYAVPELLGLVLERATGVRYAPYLSEKLWQPLGNGAAEVWLDRPEGRAYQNAAFFASARDWLHLGVLLAERGRFAGRQVVPAAWINTIAAPSAANPAFGFLWRGSPHVRERKLSERVNYYSLVGEPFARDDVLIVDGYVHRLFAVPSERLVVLHVGAPGRVSGERRARWDDAALLNPLLRELAPLASR